MKRKTNKSIALNIYCMCSLHKNKILTFLLLLFYLFVQGQKETKRQWVITHTSIGIEKFQVLEINSQIKDGTYILYKECQDSSQYIAIQGYYENNFKEGTWTTYFRPKNKADMPIIESLIHYKFGLKHGDSLFFNRVQDTIKYEHFINNKVELIEDTK